MNESENDPSPSFAIFEVLEPSSFKYWDEDDDFLYHVTSEPNARRISEEGFDLDASRMFGKAYHGHSAERVFFTDKSGVMFWMSRIEDRLFDQFDEPPEVAVIRVPKSLLQEIAIPDPIGTEDSKHPAWIVSAEDLPTSMQKTTRRRPRP